MTVHTIIESLSAYEAVRAKDPKGQRVWWTTSPALLIDLPRRGEMVRSSEEDFPQDVFDGLARACREAAEDFCALLDTRCPWADYARFDMVFGLLLWRSLFVSLYKGLLLSRVLQAAAGSPVTCAGDPDLSPNSLSLTFNRFDTLFVSLARRLNDPGITIFEHRAPRDSQQNLHHKITHRELGRIEKILSLLSNTPGSFVYKAWQSLTSRGRRLPIGLALTPFPRKTFFIHKDCELLDEAIFGILLRLGRVTFLAPLPKPDLGLVLGEPAPTLEEASAWFHEAVMNRTRSIGLRWNPVLGAALDMAIQRTIQALTSLQANLPLLTQGFEQITARLVSGDEILTNALESVEERLFYCFCKARGIRVNAFDHGITLGLSEWSMEQARHTGMRAADRAFYHCQRAVQAVTSYASHQETHVVGLPHVTSKPPLRFLQRRLARKLLGIDPGDHVIMIVGDLDRNNYIYGPCQDNDLQYLVKTRQITESVCQAFPSSRVILKLYPTQRYLDEYTFTDLKERYSNLHIIKYVEFRFLRTAADLLFTSSTQSTLGWVSGAGVPYLYLDFVWSPGKIGGLKLQLPKVNGLASMVLPDVGQICSPARESVAQILFRDKRS